MCSPGDRAVLAEWPARRGCRKVPEPEGPSAGPQAGWGAGGGRPGRERMFCRPTSPCSLQVIFRFALALFKYKEEEILKLQDPMSMFKYLRYFTRTILDAR